MSAESDGGYVFAVAPCLVCRRLFAFNPRLVPSKQGEPICQTCMGRVNALRKELGREPFVIPEGAYEPAPAAEVL